MKFRLTQQQVVSLASVGILLLVFSTGVFAEDRALLNLRGKIFNEAKAVKDFADVSNIVVVSSIWDTCLITVNQIDAYRSMVAIFNLVKLKRDRLEAADYLIEWLAQMKVTTEMSIKSLNPRDLPVDKKLKMRLEVLKAYFATLEGHLNKESKKILKLKEVKTKK